MKLKPATVVIRAPGDKLEKRKALLSPDKAFAIHYTIPAKPRRGWSITHTPSGLAIAKYLHDQRTAELIVAGLRAVPLPWNRKAVWAIQNAYKTLPPALQTWLRSH
jgi:hypothetical protein